MKPIIRAYAEQTPNRVVDAAYFTDHPRVRGADRFKRKTDRTQYRSSARTRSRHVSVAVEGVGRPIIRAYAEQTLTRKTPTFAEIHD